MSYKKKVLFFARDYQSNFHPSLSCEDFESIYVTLTTKEKKNVENKGGKVVGCLEEVYLSLEEAKIEFPYLDYSLGSDRHLIGHSHEQRISILKKCVFFWRQIFEMHKPDFVYNEVVAIEISEIMHIESRRLGIKYLAYGSLSVNRTFYWMDNPFHSSMRKKFKEITPSNRDLLEAEEYINKVRTGPIDNPFIKAHKLGKNIGRLIKFLKLFIFNIFLRIKVRNKIIRQLCYGYSLKYHFDELKYYFNYIFKSRKYDTIESLNINDEFAFYPLHFEPEATLFYMSTYYENQFAFIENILKCLPENQFLLIKEHPAQAGFLMQSKWINLKKRFPNLRLIKAEVASKKIITRSKVVITLVSTAGFEAAVLGKKVIVFGKIYYDFFSGINFCSTFEEAYELLRGKKPFNKSIKSDLIKELAKLISIQNEGNPWPHNELYSSKNLNNIRNAIKKVVLSE